MPELTPTPEQLAIIDAARSSTDNLLITALAGAAKTSTLVLIAEALPETQILTCAFNTRIAKEMAARLPHNCEARTLNSLGHEAWKNTIGRRLILDDKKTYRIVKGLVDALPSPERRLAYERFADIMRAVDLGKANGYVPTGHHPNAKFRVLDDAEFFGSLDEEPSELEEDLIRSATLASLAEALSGKIDYNDQILMPTVFPAIFPMPPLVMVDEAQDLSALNHAMLRKFARKRIIAVGDECQAIYGFRGAHENSMRLLQQQYSMRELRLTISFRCPIAIVQAARWRAPFMQWPEWAKPGDLAHWQEWRAGDLPDDAVIICRNNAPLFSLAIKLLKNGRYPELVGNDIGKTLIKWLKKLGPENLTREEAYAALDSWRAERLRKARNPEKVEDQVACLAVFIDQGKTLGAAIAYAEHILAASGPVKLMTGHKAKGLEFPHVFFLDESLVRKEGQDPNLRYVIITRAKESLTYIRSELFQDNEDEA